MSSVITVNTTTKTELADLINNSQNNLLVVFTPVLEQIMKLRAGVISPSHDLRSSFDGLLKEAEQQASQLGYPTNQVQSAKFALVAFIDETVLTADFPLRQEWEKYPLQLEYFGEHLAGVKFFERLDELLKDNPPQLEVIETYYISLLLGYKGRYKIYLEAQLQELINNLTEYLQKANRIKATDLSPHGRVSDQPQPMMDTGIPLWIKLTVIGAFAFSVFTYIVFKFLLHNQIIAVKEQLLR
jgi:type VI secretion system protein ImpK